MTNDEMLAMLKIDLGITTEAYDQRLLQLLESAQTEIEDKGATLNLESIAHCNLVIMFAAWRWRRRDTGEGMPRMVKRALNNLIFGQKMEGEG